MTVEWTENGRLTAASKVLEYACFGPAPDKAPTLVLLHEGLGSVALWRDFPQALAQATGFGVFAFSRAGYGQSDPADLPRPLDYMTREAVDVLPQVLDAIGFRRGVLVGHSDGATIATIYAGSVSDQRVRALVLMAPHFFTEEVGLAEIAKAKQAYATTDLREKMARYHRDPDNTFRGWNDSWLHPDFKAWNVADAIDYLRIPVLAVQGREDQYGTLAQVEEVENRSYAPVEIAILDDCRHAPHLDQPERVVAEIAGFCTRLERIEAAAPEVA
ncbi:alpha/beta hydrolase [Antarctobacter sp.]|uniref:alpha/beta fold hydrolase n=1 Tax=Antarctobacter sp. TaxID=1872577 RepID=UPI002B268C51|nr:alpha/beta hydrolase [Antarctobacter sp.]